MTTIYRVSYSESWFRDKYGARGSKIHASTGNPRTNGTAACGVKVSISTSAWLEDDHYNCKRCERIVTRRMDYA